MYVRGALTEEGQDPAGHKASIDESPHHAKAAPVADHAATDQNQPNPPRQPVQTWPLELVASRICVGRVTPANNQALNVGPCQQEHDHEAIADTR